jgi:hypothetical protein
MGEGGGEDWRGVPPGYLDILYRLSEDGQRPIPRTGWDASAEPWSHEEAAWHEWQPIDHAPLPESG